MPSDPSLDAWIEELVANTDDITAAVGLVYGPVGARAFNQQWAQHTQFLVDYAVAISRGDDAAATLAREQLQIYAEDSGSFFATATTGGLPADAVRELLDTHVGAHGRHDRRDRRWRHAGGARRRDRGQRVPGDDRTEPHVGDRCEAARGLPRCDRDDRVDVLHDRHEGDGQLSCCASCSSRATARRRPRRSRPRPASPSATWWVSSTSSSRPTRCWSPRAPIWPSTGRSNTHVPAHPDRAP